MIDKETHEAQLFRLRTAFAQLQKAIESGARFFPDCAVEIYPLSVQTCYGGRYNKAARAVLAFNSCCRLIYENEFQRENPYKYGCFCVDVYPQILAKGYFGWAKKATRNLYEITKDNAAAALAELAENAPE